MRIAMTAHSSGPRRLHLPRLCWPCVQAAAPACGLNFEQLLDSLIPAGEDVGALHEAAHSALTDHAGVKVGPTARQRGGSAGERAAGARPGLGWRGGPAARLRRQAAGGMQTPLPRAGCSARRPDCALLRASGPFSSTPRIHPPARPQPPVAMFACHSDAACAAVEAEVARASADPAACLLVLDATRVTSEKALLVSCVSLCIWQGLESWQGLGCVGMLGVQPVASDQAQLVGGACGRQLGWAAGMHVEPGWHTAKWIRGGMRSPAALLSAHPLLRSLSLSRP